MILVSCDLEGPAYELVENEDVQGCRNLCFLSPLNANGRNDTSLDGSRMLNAIIC